MECYKSFVIDILTTMKRYKYFVNKCFTLVMECYKYFKSDVLSLIIRGVGEYSNDEELNNVTLYVLCKESYERNITTSFFM